MEVVRGRDAYWLAFLPLSCTGHGLQTFINLINPMNALSFWISLVS